MCKLCKTKEEKIGDRNIHSLVETIILGQPKGMVWGGRREEGSGWGTRVYLWRIHVDIWQNQYNIVKLKNKIKKNNTILKQKTMTSLTFFTAYSCSVKGITNFFFFFHMA